MTWQFYVYFIAPGLVAMAAAMFGIFAHIDWLAIVGGGGVVIWLILMWPIIQRLNSDV